MFIVYNILVYQILVPNNIEIIIMGLERKRTIFQPKFTNPSSIISTDGPDNAIRLLKTDWNSLIWVLEIDQTILLKFCS